MSYLGPHLGSQPAQDEYLGLLPRQEQRRQGTAPWPGAASLRKVMPSFGELEGKVAVAALQMGSLGMSPACGAATPVTCVPASASVFCSSWMQCCSSSDARLRLAVKGCSFCGGHTHGSVGAACP